MAWWPPRELLHGGLTPGSLQGTEHFGVEVPNVII